MELKNIINTLANKHKGTFVRVGWTSQIESAAARKSGIVVEKKTDTTVRWGIKYDNIAKVKADKAARVAAGTPTQERKPWYSHLEQCPHIIRHLSDPTKTYLQLFTVKGSRSRVRYYINGVEATKDEVMASGYVNGSEWKSTGECVIMNIPTANIRFIGKEV